MSTPETTQTDTASTVVSFDDMFKELSLLDEGKEVPAKAEPAAEQPVSTAEEKPAEEPAPADAPAPAPAPAEAPAEEPPVDNTDEVLQRLARLVKDEPVSREEPEHQPVQQDAPVYSKDEQEFLQAYEKDWPDVARAEALRRRAEYRELINYVFTEVSKELRPVVETVQAMGSRTHLADLKNTVTDYEDVRDKVVDWVGTQPAYLQIAYKHVIQNGSVEEVADLVSRYKRETGVTATPAAAPAARKTETELPSATKKAAAELAPVSSKRAAVVTNADPETFEDAFAMFAKS